MIGIWYAPSLGASHTILAFVAEMSWKWTVLPSIFSGTALVIAQEPSSCVAPLS